MSQALLWGSIWGTLGGLTAAAATVFGAVPTLFKSRRGFSLLTHMSMDFALGMMLAASAYSLIAPAGQAALQRGGLFALTPVLLSIIAGALFIKLMGVTIDRFRPSNKGRGDQNLGDVSHHHIQNIPNTSAASTKRANGPWLFIVAMMLHNLPEGLASGAALAGLDWHRGAPILGAIALQNVPEGLTTAVAFAALGATTRMAFLGAVASALVELVGGTIGGFLLGSIHDILPTLLAFAGGAMLFVAGQEALERWSISAVAGRMKVVRDMSLGMGFMVLLSFVMGT